MRLVKQIKHTSMQMVCMVSRFLQCSFLGKDFFFTNFSLKPYTEFDSTSVYLHFRIFQYIASGSYFRSELKIIKL